MSSDAKHWKMANGKYVVDRRKELDDKFTWKRVDENGNEKTGEVLKSAMVGSVYYAAVRINGSKIGAVVCLTRGKGRDGTAWGFKDMDETMCPCETKCPASILALLTPTDSENANEWRAQCRENIRKSAEVKKHGASAIYAPTGVQITILGHSWVLTSKEYREQTGYSGCKFTKAKWHDVDLAVYTFVDIYGTGKQKSEYAASGRRCPAEWKKEVAA